MILVQGLIFDCYIGLSTCSFIEVLSVLTSSQLYVSVGSHWVLYRSALKMEEKYHAKLYNKQRNKCTKGKLQRVKWVTFVKKRNDGRYNLQKHGNGQVGNFMLRKWIGEKGIKSNELLAFPSFIPIVIVSTLANMHRYSFHAGTILETGHLPSRNNNYPR